MENAMDEKDLARRVEPANSVGRSTAEINKHVPVDAERTRHGGNCGPTPFYLLPGQGSPEYDQGHSIVVWYDDLYNLAVDKQKAEAEVARLTSALQTLTEERDTAKAMHEGISRYLRAEQVGCSTDIADSPSFGYGKLDNYGFWEFPIPAALADLGASDRHNYTNVCATAKILNVTPGQTLQERATQIVAHVSELTAALQTAQTLIATWRGLSAGQRELQETNYAKGSDGERWLAFAFKKASRIYRECADELQNVLPPLPDLDKGKA